MTDGRHDGARVGHLAHDAGEVLIAAEVDHRPVAADEVDRVVLVGLDELHLGGVGQAGLDGGVGLELVGDLVVLAGGVDRRHSQALARDRMRSAFATEQARHGMAQKFHADRVGLNRTGRCELGFGREEYQFFGFQPFRYPVATN